MDRTQPDRRLETVLSDMNKRIRALEEITTSSRILPPQYGFRINGSGQLVIFNRETGAETAGIA